MILTFSALIALAQGCAPTVAPATLLSVAAAESAFDPLAIGVNSRPRLSLHPATYREALALAGALAARKANFDVGLAQINARTLPRLGLALDQAFDPCRNLAAEARVLTGDYEAARRSALSSQAALQAMLSRYNTGDPVRGMRNGYVAKIYRAAAEVVPALAAPPAELEPATVAHAAPTSDASPLAQPSAPPPHVELDVFGRPSPLLLWSASPVRKPGDPS